MEVRWKFCGLLSHFSHAQKKRSKTRKKFQTKIILFDDSRESGCGHLHLSAWKVDLKHAKWQVLRASHSLEYDENKAIETIIHCGNGEVIGKRLYYSQTTSQPRVQCSLTLQFFSSSPSFVHDVI
jgi:hypothetical protein